MKKLLFSLAFLCAVIASKAETIYLTASCKNGWVTVTSSVPIKHTISYVHVTYATNNWNTSVGDSYFWDWYPGTPYMTNVANHDPYNLNAQIKEIVIDYVEYTATQDCILPDGTRYVFQ